MRSPYLNKSSFTPLGGFVVAIHDYKTSRVEGLQPYSIHEGNEDMKVHGTIALILGVVFSITAAVVANVAFEDGAWVPFLSMFGVMLVAVFFTAWGVDDGADGGDLLFVMLIAAVVGAIIAGIAVEGAESGSYGQVIPWVTYGFGLVTYAISCLVQLIADDW